MITPGAHEKSFLVCVWASWMNWPFKPLHISAFGYFTTEPLATCTAWLLNPWQYAPWNKPIICTVSYYLKSIGLTLNYTVIPTISFSYVVSVSRCCLFPVISQSHHVFTVKYHLLLCDLTLYAECLHLLCLFYIFLYIQDLIFHASPVKIADLVFQYLQCCSPV